ncbi:hypothetical protein ACVBEJ_07405 [Porticoccus sp. GXU_MW_L64]
MSKLFTLIAAIALCSGCAYNNAISRGDQQFTDGNYEHAVAAYQQALIKKPDSVKAQQKLAIAQQQLDIWSEQIAAAAQRADNSNLPALAAALYQKQAQLEGDSQAANRAADLRQQLSRTYRPQVFVKGAPELLAATTTPLPAYRAEISNHLLLEVQASAPRFNTEEFDGSGSHQYVSGTITRSNPHYLTLQDDLQTLHYKLEQLREELHYQELGTETEQRHLDRLKGALDEQRRLLAATTVAAEQVHIQHRIDELTLSRRHSKDKLEALHHDYDDTHHHIEEYQQEYSQLEYELADTPQELVEDAYATYEYPLTEVVQSAALTLHFHQAGQKSGDEVIYQYSDQVYNGNHSVGLPADPREPLSRREMHNYLNDLAAQRVAEQVEATAAAYHQKMLDNALAQADPQQKLDRLMRYALSGGVVDPELQQLADRLLRSQFGTAGTLNAVELLKI